MTLLSLSQAELTEYLTNLQPFVKFQADDYGPALSPADFALRMNDKKQALLSDADQALLLGLFPETAAAVAGALRGLLDASLANNVKRRQLADYQAATARLARYRLADGRPEQTINETLPDQFDAQGIPLISTTVIPAIEPLPATITEDVIDPTTGAVTGSQDVPNPAILLDDAERAEAQEVIDATPAEVVTFAAGL